MGKHILIAGAGGYIGSLMVEEFLEKGYRITALDRYFFGDNLQDLAKNSALTIIKDDTRYFDESILEDVDVVIDLSSISNDPSSELLPTITEAINHKGALRLATLAKKMGVKKYILSSSCSVYGAGDSILNEESTTAPISTYAKCKIAAERDILPLANDNFCVTFLRNGTVYGLSKRRMRFDLIINIMTLHAWKNNKLFVMGGGKQWRPLVHITDVIQAFELVVKEKNIEKINRQVINVGSNEQNYQVFQVANQFKIFFPNLIIEETPDDSDPRNYHVNFDKVGALLDFKVKKTINDGIEEVKKALERGEVTDSIITKTVDYYKYLVNADNLLSSVKINNILF